MNKTLNNFTNQELIKLLDTKLEHIKDAYSLKCYYVSRNESIELIGIVRFFRYYLDLLTGEQYNSYIDLSYEMKEKSETAIANRKL